MLVRKENHVVKESNVLMDTSKVAKLNREIIPYLIKLNESGQLNDFLNYASWDILGSKLREIINILVVHPEWSEMANMEMKELGINSITDIVNDMINALKEMKEKYNKGIKMLEEIKKDIKD